MLGVAVGLLAVAGGAELAAPRLFAAATAALPKVPFEKFQDWGRNVVQWGRGAAGAIQRVSEVTAEQASKLDPQKVKMARDFYQKAVDAGRGGAAAPERVKLMERILDLQQRTH